MSTKEIELNHDLNDSQKRFVSLYLGNGFNGSQAYRTAYKKSNLRTCEASSSRLLRNVKVKKEIDRQLKELFNNDFYELKYRVIEELKKIAFSGDNNYLKVRALDLIARYLNMFKEENNPEKDIGFEIVIRSAIKEDKEKEINNLIES